MSMPGHICSGFRRTLVKLLFGHRSSICISTYPLVKNIIAVVATVIQYNPSCALKLTSSGLEFRRIYQGLS